MLNTAAEYIDKPDKERCPTHHTSGNRLVPSYIEKGDCRVRFAINRSTLDVIVGIIGAIVVLDIAGNEDLYIPVTSSRHFLTSSGYLDQIGLNDFTVRKAPSPVFSTLNYRSDAIRI